ncbi:hypothetical protein [Jannaschia ovalis]|uniref:DUF2157 domain-containing protein n=1 Tax=Jannaschia ovalis TaxID=3038773 RepID=A0ABY8LIP3_9RHOB|nr:hypothetical protein [Jannaschia sp. GRR-S6-38]WGH80280.1 hypothetical protein P8627_08450 [Jannaschia sp. GRR-S6-38]
MTLEPADLRAAVGAGIVTEAQAARLAALAADRRNGRDGARPGEEPFELFRGFNEIFIVVGLGILASGWFGVLALAAGLGDWSAVWTLGLSATLLLIALLAEYFIRRRRMVAPAILLTVGWTIVTFGLLSLLFRSVTLLGGVDPEGSILPLLLTALAVGAFWLRYRVPFAMAAMAAAAFGALILTLAAATGEDVTTESLLLLSGEGPFALGTLAFGLVLFGFAMRFDMADPHRVSLRSASGFWLHVVAAPAIVNTVALSLLEGGTGARALLAVFLAAIALVAVVIDRRSFLISAAGYTVALVAVATEGDAFAPVILAIGAALVALGAGWQAARARLVAPLPGRLRDRLPPAA